MARSNQLVTLEVTNSAKEIGQLYPARRVHSTIDTGGIVQWVVDYNVLCFEINNVIPEVDRLYKARKARTRTGLVSGKPVYMLEYCCGLIDDDDRYWVSCEEFIGTPHTVVLDYVTCYFPDPTVVTFRTATFTISPQGDGRLEGRGSWSRPFEGPSGTTTLTEYFKVVAYCLTLDLGEGLVEGIRWELQPDGQQYGEGPIIDLNSQMFYSFTPMNADIDIYGYSGSYCSGEYTWTENISGPISNPYRLRV